MKAAGKRKRKGTEKREYDVKQKKNTRKKQKNEARKCRGKNIDKRAKELLTQWLFSSDHFDFPYPDAEVSPLN